MGRSQRDETELLLKATQVQVGTIRDIGNAGLAITVNAGLALQDGKKITSGSTTGLTILDSASDKLGFWNKAPIVQPSGATQAAGAGYTTGAYGLNSNVNMQALYDLVQAIRTALVNCGIMKGGA